MRPAFLYMQGERGDSLHHCCHSSVFSLQPDTGGELAAARICRAAYRGLFPVFWDAWAHVHIPVLLQSLVGPVFI